MKYKKDSFVSGPCDRKDVVWGLKEDYSFHNQQSEKEK